MKKYPVRKNSWNCSIGFNHCIASNKFMAKLIKKHFEGRSWYISFVAQVPANGTLACLDVLDDQLLWQR